MAEIKWEDKNFTVQVEVTVKKNIRKGLTIVKKAAQANCPIGDVEREAYKTGKYAGKEWTGRKPGTLKKSIRIRMSKKKMSGQVIAGQRSKDDLTAYYAHIIEFGGQKSGRIARPFMRPALESTFDAVMDSFKDTLP